MEKVVHNLMRDTVPYQQYATDGTNQIVKVMMCAYIILIQFHNQLMAFID